MIPITLHFRVLMACVAYFGSVRSFVRFGHGTFTGPDPCSSTAAPTSRDRGPGGR